MTKRSLNMEDIEGDYVFLCADFTPTCKDPKGPKVKSTKKMASEATKELEIPIWVKGTQKWVTGLTKRTTCDDVIYALMYNDGHVNTAAWAIFEKWRDVERPLQGRTKIVKVWRAWGAEQNNVHLAMRRIDEMEYSGEFSLTRRKKKSRHKTRERERDRDREKERHSHERRHHHGYCQNTTERLRSMETLVKLVISQERKLKDLIEHGDDTDKLIEKYESKVHSNRLKQNGDDYVQDAYLEGYGDTTQDSMDDFLAKANVEELELYVEFCDKIIALEGKINTEHSKVEELAYQIQQCVNDENTTSGARASDCDSSAVQVELNRAVSCAIMQQYKFQDLQRELKFYEEKLKSKEEVMFRLQLELSDLETTDTSGHGSDSNASSPSYNSAMKHSHSSDSIKPVNPPPLPERTKRPSSVENTRPTVLPGQINNPLPVPERSRQKTCDSPSSNPASDNHRTVSAISEPVIERKPILKQSSSDSKTGFYEQKETKVRFKTDSVVDRYHWDESSLSEGISMDHSDCSDSKDILDCIGKRESYSLIRSGVPDRPYLTVKVEDNDSNSDTGLSSMHSDDSAVYHLETLV